VSSEFVKELANSQHMYISKERHKLEDRHLHVNRSTFHWACFLIPDYDGVYKQRWWKNATLLDTHTSLPRGFTSSVYRGIFSIAVALVFTAVLHIFTHGGRKVGARGKDEVLPQPDGSIVSGGTVYHRVERTPNLWLALV